MTDLGLYQKSLKLGCHFWEKKVAQVAPDDNNNNNNNRDETTVPSQFTPQFTVYKANTMTDSYIRSTVKCEMWIAMNFGFLRGI